MNARLRLALAAGLAALLASGCVTTVDNPEREEIPEEAAKLNVQLGANYLRQGKLDLAKEKLDKALSQDPSLATAHTYSALVYDQLGEAEDAETHYRRSLRLAPGDSATLNLYGAFLCRQDRATEAEEYFVKATADPLYRTPWAALTNAGVCLLRVPDQDRAEAYFRRALSTNPRYPDALWHMARLSYERKVYHHAGSALARRADRAPARRRRRRRELRTPPARGLPGVDRDPLPHRVGARWRSRLRRARARPAGWSRRRRPATGCGPRARSSD